MNCNMCQDTRWIRIDGGAKLRRALILGDSDEPVQAVCPACNTHGEYPAEPLDWSKVPLIKCSLEDDHADLSM